MHPVIQQFSQRRPRLYGLLALMASILFALVGRQITPKYYAFAVLLLSVVAGLTGILYLAFGSTCAAWDAKFVASFDSNRVSWRQALGLCGLGAMLLVLTLILYSSIK